MKIVELKVDGMTCESCVRHVTDALKGVPGVERCEVSLEKGRAVVHARKAEPETLVRAVEKAGYKARAGAAGPGEEPWDMSPGVPEGKPDGAYDLAVIGGGSAGFAAAIRAADLGARVALIEGGTLGGTCVNVGCVPSKTLIRAAETVHRAAVQPFRGIRAAGVVATLSEVIQHKDELVEALRQAKYWDVLAAYPAIRLIQGRARFEKNGRLAVDGEPLKAGRVVIATGARPWAPPIPGLAEAGFLTSTELMAVTDLPRRLIVIGASAVGLELAQTFSRLGSKVTVLEALPRIAPSEDPDLSDDLTRHLTAEGLTIHAGVRLTRVVREHGRYRVRVERDGPPAEVEGDALLVATGRRPNTAGLGLEQIGVKFGKKGEILVNEHLRTDHPTVYAAGDCIGDPMFVYVSAYGGHLAAENALQGDVRRYDLTTLPRVTFTDPQVASVGLTEAQAREQGLSVEVARLPMSHVPRALAARDTRGLIKLVAEAGTGRLVGAHLVAPEAGEMIQEAVLAMKFGITVPDLASTFHPYLTNAEGLKLAAQTFHKDVAKLSCCAA